MESMGKVVVRHPFVRLGDGGEESFQFHCIDSKPLHKSKSLENLHAALQQNAPRIVEIGHLEVIKFFESSVQGAKLGMEVPELEKVLCVVAQLLYQVALSAIDYHSRYFRCVCDVVNLIQRQLQIILLFKASNDLFRVPVFLQPLCELFDEFGAVEKVELFEFADEYLGGLWIGFLFLVKSFH